MTNTSSTNQRPIAVIPAKGYSTRTHAKNIRKYAGVPCVVRVIREALNSGIFSDVIVSTDDTYIRDLARGEGVQGHMRSGELLDGELSVSTVWKSIVRGSPARSTCLLYANNPMLMAETIHATYDIHLSNNFARVHTVQPYKHPPTRAKILNDDSTLTTVATVDMALSTGVTTYYHDAGLLIWDTVTALTTPHTPPTPAIAYITTPFEAHEIDDPIDEVVASALLAHRMGTNNPRGG